MQSVFREAFAEAGRVLQSFSADPYFEKLTAAAHAICETFRSRGRVLACGNGGSMADAMHFCEEFSGRFRNDRPPYPAIALSDPTHLTCVANDYGYEYVFSRQVEALGHDGDCLLVLSTSGNSASIVRATQAAKERKMTAIGFLGKGGGEVAALCDIAIVAPGATSDRIQELHMLALHALIEAVELELGH